MKTNRQQLLMSVLGIITFICVSMGLQNANAQTTFTNAAAISIPALGTATPYPSNITVSGMTGTTTNVNVRLNNAQHTFATDLDMLLVGPLGQTFVMMSDASSAAGLDVATTFTISDAGILFPTTGNLAANGVYQPRNVGAGDAFAAPAPVGPHNNPVTAGTSTFATIFNGSNPNGVWSLYIVDDLGGDLGSVSGGWSLIITTSGPPPTVLVPATGSNSVACGTNTTLQDNGGAGNYANPSNGFTVLNGGGSAVININGTYSTESGWDFIRIFNGSGTGGTLLQTFTGAGTINFTGTPGQTLTFQFTADAIINAPGFDVVVTYTGACVAAPVLVPATGSNSIACGVNSTLQDNGGTGNYASPSNGFTVLNAANTAVININGTYNVESGWDFIRIYNGSGTGGTLLQTFTGAGSINFTGAPGQTLTFQFTADVSISAPGFSMAITYTGNCVAAPLLIPTTGSISVACGTNVTLQDNGGTGNYVNSSNGFAVLNGGGAAVININGTYNIESGWDFIRIYNGSGTGGTLLQTFTGVGSINFTGTPGQTLTFQFTSDLSVVGIGFNVAVSYTGSCIGAPILVPATGFNSIACGTNSTLQDNGGLANYANSSNGYTILNAAATAVININGTYNVESGWDFIRIYNGSGTGGTLLQTFTGVGSINFTGTPGQTLTVQFTSDGVINAPGFSLAITYTGSCIAAPVLVPTTGSNSVACGTNVTLQDNGGLSNYANASNGFTVLNSQGAAVININGTFSTESGWDFIRIYSGSGTGGTLLATFTGAGSINFTGTPGQTLTFQFTSDAIINGVGFSVAVTYSGSCAVAPTLVPFSGSNSLPCGINAVLQDNGGLTNYANGSNGFTVINAGTASVININGTYNVESGWDFIRIYSGVGIGGPLLATFTGAGTMNFTGAVGQTLTFRFTSDVSINGVGFDVNVSFTGSCIQPLNDLCSSVTPVALATGSNINFSGTTVGATQPGDGPFTPNPSVWHAITTTTCATIVVNYCASTPPLGNVWLNLATNCPVTTFTAPGTFNNTSCGAGNVNYTVTWLALPAGTYWIPVMGLSTTAGFINTPGPYTINVAAIACAPPPSNNECLTAIPITPAVICSNTPGTTVMATQSLAPATCTGFTSSSALDVWYSFVADGISTNYTVYMTGLGGMDGIIQLFSGTCPSPLVSLGCADATVGNGIESFNGGTLAAGTYYYRIYGWAGSTGTFTTCVTYSPCLAPNVGGVASGPGSPCALSPTSYTVTGGSGGFLWEVSNNGGASYSPIPGGNSATVSYSFPALGNYLIRVRRTGGGCADAFSNTVSVSVTQTGAVIVPTATPGTVCSGSLVNLASNAYNPNLPPSVSTFSSTGPVSIPGIGTSTPYPSNIVVSAMPSVISGVAVRFNNMIHSFATDIDMLLVGPGGQTFVLFSDASNSSALDAARTFTIADGGIAFPTTATALTNGATYLPTNIGAGDPFAAPAPAGPHNNPATAGTATFASVYGGTNPNGTWSLYVVDDLGGDLGTIPSWDLIFSIPNTSGLTYSWSNGATTASTSDNPTTSPTTTYNLTVTVTANGCVANTSVSVNVNPVPESPANVSDIVNTPLCVDDPNGLNLQGANYAAGQATGNTYLWTSAAAGGINSGNLVDGQTYTEFPVTIDHAGTYTLLITNSFGCTSSTDYEIVVNPLPVLTSVTVGNNDYVDQNCIGTCVGEVTVTASPGTSPFTYTPSIGVSQQGSPSATFTNLCAGLYSYHVSDANGCENIAGTDVSVEVLLLDTIKPQITCISDVQVFNTPGLCSGIATWTGPVGTDNCAGETTAQSGGDPSGSVFQVGVHPIQYTVTDASNNSATCSFNVIVIDNEDPSITCPPDVVFNTSATNPGDCFVTAALVNIGNPVTGDNCAVQGISNNVPVEYPVGGTIVDWEVEDVNGNKSNCQQFVIVVDDELPEILGMPLSFTYTPDPSDCTPEITWTAPTATDNCAISSLTSIPANGSEFSEGTTTVVYTAIDVNSNQTTASFTVTITPQPLVVITSAHLYQCGFNVTCNGSSNGQATATVSGGCLPYTYLWSNGHTNATTNFTLAAGTHTVTVTDFNGHVTVQTVTLTQPPVLSTTLGPDQAFEFGCTCADLVPVTTGGSNCNPPYTYAWSTFATTSTINVCPGQTTSYFVVVTDDNGCTASDVIQVIKPPLVAQLDRYVLMGLGTQDDDIGNNTTLVSGAFGHRGSSGKIKIQNNSAVSAWVAGNNVEIGNNNQIVTLYRNIASIGSGNVIGTTVTPVAIPLTAKVPCFPVFSGGANVNVAGGATVTISPGTFNQVTLGNGSTLRLNPGVYRFDKLQTGNNSFILPVAPATAKDVFIFVKNEVQTGNNNTVHASIYAKKALQLGNTVNGEYRGSFLSGEKIQTGNNGDFYLDSYCFSNLPLCNNKEAGPDHIPHVSELNLFPNPNSGTFTIQYSGETGNELHISVLNMLGQVLYERKVMEFLGEMEQEIDVKELPTGMYYIQLSNGSELVNKQFVITR